MPTESETTTFPKRRIRVNHKWTAKDGWRLDETCVEIEFSPNAHRLEVGNQLTDLMNLAKIRGQIEADERNEAAS